MLSTRSAAAPVVGLARLSLPILFAGAMVQYAVSSSADLSANWPILGIQDAPVYGVVDASSLVQPGNPFWVSYSKDSLTYTLLRRKHIETFKLLARRATGGAIISYADICTEFTEAWPELGLNGLIDALMMPGLPIENVQELLIHHQIIHTLGAWAMATSLSLPLPNATEQLFRVTMQSLPFALSFSSAPTHGALWYRMAHHRNSDPHELWKLIRRLCDFPNVDLWYHRSCVHGSGHGFMLNRLTKGSNVIVKSCVMIRYHGRSTSESELQDAVDGCNYYHPGAHACLEGVWDQYFETTPTVPTTANYLPGPCAYVEGMSSPCFMYYSTANGWFFEKQYPQFTFDSCLSLPMRSEENRLGCIVMVASSIGGTATDVCKQFFPGPSSRRVIMCMMGQHLSQRLAMMDTLCDDIKALKAQYIWKDEAIANCKRMVPRNMVDLDETLSALPFSMA